ncbi:hypothetical protein BG006_004748 [Podila minutissima]|uniref:Uncharacterized protein n=1 Tax=Podila minutissima TaxID=64525 RepID=A0A9P5SNW8_9FUNG|nr:hypothetical protein BG006_004748 [Podila minutissima]
MMTDRRRKKIIKSEDKPVLDSTIYRRLAKKPKSSDDLPYRKLYNLEILNSAGTSYQSLENLQTKGPFQARGSVPIEDTIRSTGDSKERGRLINIRATSIVEWTHEFNPSNVMEPVIWLRSDNICWYQVQNMHPDYDPWIRPLADVCVYLDALIHAHFTLKVNDELNDLAPKLSKLLNMSISAVWDALREHQVQILGLCKNDTELKKLKFVQTWLIEKAPSSRRSQSVQPNSRESTPSSTSASNSTSAASRPMPALTPDVTAMARTKASIKLAQRQLKALLPPPHHPSELEPVIVDLEGDEKVHKEKVGIYKGLPTPCPDNCPLHARRMVFHSEAIQELEILLKSKYDKDDSKDKDSKGDQRHYSGPDNFQCPIDTCLISVSNSLSPTSSDFTEIILQHLCEHDLTASNMEHIKQYLATSQPSAAKLELKVKNSQKGVPRLFSQSTGEALNVHLYWELQAGNFQFKAGNPHISTSGATRQSALRNIPTQIRGGRRQARTWSVQRPALSDLEPRTHAQRRQRIVSSSDASQSSTAHEAQLQRFSLDRAPSQASNNTEASGDTTVTDPLTLSVAVTAHQDATSATLTQSHPPSYAIEITDDDGDDEESNMTGTEDETIATGFIRHQPNGRSVEATRQRAQPQGSARITAFSSKYRDVKRDRSDSYDDDFMQPKHRTPYGSSRFGSAPSTDAPIAAPMREFIEIHGSDSEEASSEKDDKYAPSQLGRKRQRTEEYSTSMSSLQSGHRANRSSTVNTSPNTSINPSHSDSDNNPSNNNSWFSWAKPTRIAMSYISSPRTDHPGKRDA